MKKSLFFFIKCVYSNKYTKLNFTACIHGIVIYIYRQQTYIISNKTQNRIFSQKLFVTLQELFAQNQQQSQLPSPPPSLTIQQLQCTRNLVKTVPGQLSSNFHLTSMISLTGPVRGVLGVLTLLRISMKYVSWGIYRGYYNSHMNSWRTETV